MVVPLIVAGEPIWCKTSPTFGEDTSGPLCGGPVDGVGGSNRTGWKWKVGLERRLEELGGYKEGGEVDTSDTFSSFSLNSRTTIFFGH